MSDEENTSGQEPEKKKKLKGFANPENRKHINRGGRKEGSRSSGPRNGEIEELFAKGALESINLLLKMMRDDKSTENTRTKIAFKFIDSHMTVEKQGGKIRVEQEDGQGNKRTMEADIEEEQEQRVNGTTGKVVSFRKLVSTEYKEPDSKEQEKSDKDSD